MKLHLVQRPKEPSSYAVLTLYWLAANLKDCLIILPPNAIKLCNQNGYILFLS